MKTSVAGITFAAIFAGFALAESFAVAENGPVAFATFIAVSLFSLLAVKMHDVVRADSQSRGAVMVVVLMTLMASAFAWAYPTWYTILAVSAFATGMVCWGFVADTRNTPETATI